MARDQARRLAKVEAALAVGSSLQEQVRGLSDLHLQTLVVLQELNELHNFMDDVALIRRFLTAVRRGHAFTLPGWTAAMNEEFAARLRQLQAGAPAS